MAPMRLEIITAERQVYTEDVDGIVAPGIEGQLGILPHHAPLNLPSAEHRQAVFLGKLFNT